MHIPPHFAETRLDVLQSLIESRPLGTLVTLSGASAEGFQGESIAANPIPFFLERAHPPLGQLQGHVARVNPLWQELDDGRESLVIFQGPQAYISPSWYATKSQTGRVVPTWNYVVVHAYGRVRAVEDRDWLDSQLEKLTRQQEAASAQPWSSADAPRDFIRSMMAGIVGIEFDITRLSGKSKLSQNQPEVNRNGVLVGLRARLRAELAAKIPAA